MKKTAKKQDYYTDCVGITPDLIEFAKQLKIMHDWFEKYDSRMSKGNSCISLAVHNVIFEGIFKTLNGISELVGYEFESYVWHKACVTSETDAA